jgi:hypothetical protein
MIAELLLGLTFAAAVAIALSACGGKASQVGPAGPAPGSPASVHPTAQLPHLAALGLDPEHLPALRDVPAASMDRLMDTFDDSLDACCEDCHAKNDPRAPTRAKRVSAEMWRRFTRELVTLDGKPAYCDSCHGGAARVLDRRDPAGLRQWMKDNYVEKLRKRGGGAVVCATCHGEPFEPKIVERLWSSQATRADGPSVAAPR